MQMPYSEIETQSLEKDKNLEAFLTGANEFLMEEQDEFLETKFGGHNVRKLAMDALNSHDVEKELEVISSLENITVSHEDNEISFRFKQDGVLIEYSLEKVTVGAGGYSDRFSISTLDISYTVETLQANQMPPSIKLYAHKGDRMFSVSIPQYDNIAYAITKEGNGYYQAEDSGQLSLREGQYTKTTPTGIEDYTVVYKDGKAYWYKEPSLKEQSAGNTEFVYLETPPFDYTIDKEANAILIETAGVIPLAIGQEDMTMRNFIEDLNIQSKNNSAPRLA